MAVFEPEAEGIVLDAEETGGDVVGRSPWALAGRRLVRNKLALAALALFALIVAVSLAAPLYSHHVAHTDPFEPNVSGTFEQGGKTIQVIQQGGGKLGLGETPVGPTWHSKYLLGADGLGRDVAARVLYGGRASLMIGVGSALLACLIALLLALIAGYFGGVVDLVISRLMDLIWAFPLYLLAISLATVLLARPTDKPLKIFGVALNARSLWIPLLIIGIVYVPYVFRPIRGQVLSLREKEFVEAAVAQGASSFRLVFREILPNVLSTVIVLLPLMIATTILTESALSYLSIGVQSPQASWGTIIQDGQLLLYTRPWVAIAPGIMIVLTVLALNVFGDGLRDALDPRSKVRMKG
jgi:peptide/nickel transport system permease protein